MTPNDRRTLFACYLGYITQAIVVNLTPLFFVIFQTEYGLTYSQIGTLILFTFVIQLLVDAAMVKLIAPLGYRTSAVAAHFASFLGLIFLGVLPRVMPVYPGILISAFFYSVGGGLIEVIVSPVVDALPGDAKASGMSLLHSFYSWGQMLVILVSTVVLRLIGGLWYCIPFLWALLPLANLFNFLTVPLSEITPEQRQNSALDFFRSPFFLLAVLLMACGGASELAMSQWASLFAERGLGVSKVVGDLLGPCLFAVFMGLGRTFYGLKGEKLHLETALFSCAALTFLCYMATVFVDVPAVALLGCALSGFGVSLMWPGVLSYTSQYYGHRAGPVMFAILAFGGDIGCSVGPWLTGKVSDLYLSVNLGAEEASQSAIKAGLLAASVFPLAMMLLILTIRRLKRSARSD